MNLRLLILGLPLIAAGALIAATPPAADSLASAFTRAKISLNARLRWEYADQANLRESDAFTLRTRIGFTTAPVDGLQATVEGENIAALNNPDDYNAAGSNRGGAGRTVIADAPVSDVNQAWLAYTEAADTLKIGRQRIVLDDARFVGDVGWRQNMQTFDAATFTAAPLDHVTTFYGYVSRVSRVFGNKAPQPDFTSDSHLVNVAYTGLPYGKLTAYAYLLGFRNSVVNSSDTFGASFAGAAPITRGAKATYRVEYAVQQDARNNPLSYRADYYRAELGAVVAPFDVGAGYEVLGSDGGRKGFATPLATLHAFNGWADEFLTTPAAGLRDAYVSGGVALPGGFPAKLIWHQFRSDFGSHDYGNELDAVLTHKIGKAWLLMAKYAHYDGKPPFFDTDKVWLQTEFTY